MRPFDYKESWLDNDGKPLAGRVSFCKLHTTIQEEIFDNQGYPMDNPVLTTTNGQLFAQVFLKDHTDYTVRFEKYVGEGDMSEDQDNWLFQYSCDAIWDTYGLTIETGTFQLCSTVAALRNLVPEHVATFGTRKIVQLGGYYEVGDKPVVLYVWNSSSTESDNGGSVIKVAGRETGRWELVNTFGVNGIDVRHFGVFGAQSAEDTTTTMSLNLGLANDYAASLGLPLYFPAIDGLTWYRVDNLNISGASFAKDTRIVGSTGTSSIITVSDPNTNLYVYESGTYGARFTIRGNEVHTSWSSDAIHVTFAPTNRLVIDSEFSSIYRTWTGIIVDVLVLADSCYFIDCIINSNRKLGDGTKLRTCKVTESMFDNSTDFATVEVFADDEINIDDFRSVANWLTLVAQVFTGGLLDFKGRTVDSSCILGTSAAVDYANAVFNGFTVRQSTVSFNGCSGRINTTTLDQVTVIDSTLAITDATEGLISAFAAASSTVAITTAASFGAVGLQYTTFAASAYRLITNFTMEYSALNSAITVNGNCICSNSTIGGNIATSPAGFGFTNCMFNAQHIINVIMANTIVVGNWIGNAATVADPVVFNVTTGTLLADDSQHRYVYSGNSGTFLPEVAEFDVYFDAANIDNQRSGSYETAVLGRCAVYIKDAKDIIMAYPWPLAEEHNVFHIGAETKYTMQISTQIDYQTFTTNRLRIGVDLVKDYVGDRPNANWIAGYLHLPIVGRLDDNVPTAIAALFRVSVKKTTGHVLVEPVG